MSDWDWLGNRKNNWLRESSGWKQGARDEEGTGLRQAWLERSKTELEEENIY